jgi:hypothetical protein
MNTTVTVSHNHNQLSMELHERVEMRLQVGPTIQFPSLMPHA